MGIQSSLYSGVSGLATNGNAMSVIGNNIANTNTVGFKTARTVFSDLLSSTISGSGGNSQVGRGVGLSVVDNIFSQGTFENTESDTDLAIEGKGFFLVKEASNPTVYYTRAGAFRFDANGFLVNPEGFRVLGKGYDANGNLQPGEPTEIQVDGGNLIPAQATQNVVLTTNLDANSAVPAVAFDPADSNSYNYAAATRIFDTLGNTHMLTTYFVKTADNAWDWNAIDEAGNSVGTGAITFNSDGTLAAGGTGTVTVPDWGNGSTAPQNIAMTFATTQFSSNSVVISQSQDGYAAGSLVKVSIDGDGNVVANYSNGESIKRARIALAKFSNPGGLEKVGGNLFAASFTSGDPRVGVSGPELGKIFTNALEQSNVDLGQEFVKMITIQRGFQANSKIITTTDELLGELINLKR